MPIPRGRPFQDILKDPIRFKPVDHCLELSGDASEVYWRGDYDPVGFIELAVDKTHVVFDDTNAVFGASVATLTWLQAKLIQYDLFDNRSGSRCAFKRPIQEDLGVAVPPRAAANPQDSRH